MLGISANILTHLHPRHREQQRTNNNNPGGGNISCTVSFKDEMPFVTTECLREMLYISQEQTDDDVSDSPGRILLYSQSQGDCVVQNSDGVFVSPVRAFIEKTTG